MKPYSRANLSVFFTLCQPKQFDHSSTNPYISEYPPWVQLDTRQLPWCQTSSLPEPVLWPWVEKMALVSMIFDFSQLRRERNNNKTGNDCYHVANLSTYRMSLENILIYLTIFIDTSNCRPSLSGQCKCCLSIWVEKWRLCQWSLIFQKFVTKKTTMKLTMIANELRILVGCLKKYFDKPLIAFHCYCFNNITWTLKKTIHRSGSNKSWLKDTMYSNTQQVK